MGNLSVTNENPGLVLSPRLVILGISGLEAREERLKPVEKLILDPPGSFLQTPIFLNIEEFFL